MLVGGGVVFRHFYDYWAEEESGGHYWEGHIWVSAAAAGGGEEHRQYLCHEGDKQGVHAQEEGTQVNHRVQFMKGESWQLSAFCSLSSWSPIS